VPEVVPCVGAVVVDEAGRLLLVLRGRPPAEGTWSLPGGRVEAGEDDVAAVAREVLEETGLVVTVGDLVGMVRRDGPDGTVYEIADYRCVVEAGDLRAGDDAADVRWYRPEGIDDVDTSPRLVETLRGWGVL
jgi:8-oxo-dGTP diphosphatase